MDRLKFFVPITNQKRVRCRPIDKTLGCDPRNSGAIPDDEPTGVSNSRIRVLEKLKNTPQLLATTRTRTE